MKILLFGDIYGRIGRNAFKKEFPLLKAKYNPDFVLANIDNISSGRGAIVEHILEMEGLGVDIMTGGDHIFDNFSKLQTYLNQETSKLLRPANVYESRFYEISGKGYSLVEKNGKKLVVIHLLGDVFMKYRVYNPFLKVDEILNQLKGEQYDGIIVDFHKEATAEGYGMGFFLDGKVSCVFGTHTHIQTNDDMILPNGTGFISDIGMSGPKFSIIGADFESVKKMFLTGIGKGKIEQSLDKHYVVNGVCIEIGEKKNCVFMEKIRIEGTL